MKAIIVGGAGFIGSHFVDRLLGDPADPANANTVVTIFDNFSSGREWHYAAHANDSRLRIIRGDVKDADALQAAMRGQENSTGHAGHDLVIHLASNPDIAKAMSDPDIDFREGTLLTRNILEAMRATGTPTLLYASGSGVYGDLGTKEVSEDYGPLIPVSTYGASKLAGEALIASYCYMFGIRACAFRFANVVGPRQTHGVGFDFVRRLLKEPGHLQILGDGTQSKSYIYVEDIVNAVLTAYNEKIAKAATTDSTNSTPFNVFNVGTDDYITVTEIAELAAEVVGLAPSSVKFEYTGGNRGWKGDVPIVRFSTQRIRGLGWKNARTTRQALGDAMRSLLADAKEGKL